MARLVRISNACGGAISGSRNSKITYVQIVQAYTRQR